MKEKIISSLIITITILHITCTQKQVVKEKKPVVKEKVEAVKIDKKNDFFSICESDINNAVGVVMEKRIVKNLTHLHRMDSGGRKYYLLEREAITKMIQAVTKGTYTDLMLVNKRGIIIYTMNNDDIFGKNVRTSLKESPLYECWNNSIENKLYVQDMSLFPKEDGSYNIFISKRYNIDMLSKGVFIMQISINIVEKIFEENIEVVDINGSYIISKNRDNILKQYSHFTKVKKENLYRDSVNRFVIDNKSYTYYPFTFKNLYWIIIESAQDSP